MQSHIIADHETPCVCASFLRVQRWTPDAEHACPAPPRPCRKTGCAAFLLMAQPSAHCVMHGPSMRGQLPCDPPSAIRWQVPAMTHTARHRRGIWSFVCGPEAGQQRVWPRHAQVDTVLSCQA